MLTSYYITLLFHCINEAKSAVDRLWNRNFLGFSFYRIKEKDRIRLAPKTVNRIRAKSGNYQKKPWNIGASGN